MHFIAKCLRIFLLQVCATVTRMHSSRMRTSYVLCSGHLGRGDLPGGCLPRRSVCLGWCLPGGVCIEGCTSPDPEADSPPHPTVNRQTPIKTLLFATVVPDGKYCRGCFTIQLGQAKHLNSTVNGASRLLKRLLYQS